MSTEPQEDFFPAPRRGWFFRIVLLLCWLALAGASWLAWDAHRFLTTPGSDEAKDIVIAIEPGATFDRVAWDLKKAGAIRDVARFRLLARWKKLLGSVKAGEYAVNTGWKPEEVLNQITRGQAILYRLKIREGLTWWETARAVEEQGFARYDDFKAVIHDPEFLRAHDIPFDSAEGFLYPETYLMPKPGPLDRKQAAFVADMMVRMFWKKTEPLWTQLPLKQGARTRPNPALAGNGTAAPGGNGTFSDANGAAVRRAAGASVPPEGGGNSAASLDKGADTGKIPSAGRVDRSAPVPADGTGRAVGGDAVAAPGLVSSASPLPRLPESPEDVEQDALRRLVILASLVEKETGVPSERTRVAGVYANRLERGMLLQCDPTIIYGVGESFSGSIRRSQIDDAKNLYNTYQHPGLPPGPICSSGLEAIAAAFAPEKHDYLYFVATADGDGGHTFSKTLSEHNKAVQEYRSRVKGK